jgi:hypothetical protein
MQAFCVPTWMMIMFGLIDKEPGAAHAKSGRVRYAEGAQWRWKSWKNRKKCNAKHLQISHQTAPEE